MNHTNAENTPEPDVAGSDNQETPRKGWVQFEDETAQGGPSTSSPEKVHPKEVPAASPAAVLPVTAPAVLNTESVHINLERGDRTTELTPQSPFKKNVEFINVRQGFCKFSKYCIATNKLLVKVN